jgi:hypothetical protein
MFQSSVKSFVFLLIIQYDVSSGIEIIFNTSLGESLFTMYVISRFRGIRFLHVKWSILCKLILSV